MIYALLFRNVGNRQKPIIGGPQSKSGTTIGAKLKVGYPLKNLSQNPVQHPIANKGYRMAKAITLQSLAGLLHHVRSLVNITQAPHFILLKAPTARTPFAALSDSPQQVEVCEAIYAACKGKRRDDDEVKSGFQHDVCPVLIQQPGINGINKHGDAAINEP